MAIKGKGAHVTMIFSKGRMSGVQNKTKQFSDAFNESGVDVYVLNREIDGYIDGIFYVNYEKYLPGYLARFLRFYVIVKCVDFSQYDFSILRYPLSDFSFFFISKYLPKIYFEHHTMEIAELERSGLPFFVKKVQVFAERLAPIFFKHCKGHISVTSQISDYEMARFGSNKSYHLFSNGLNLDFYKGIRKRNDVKKNEDVVKLVFAASEFTAWHGLDRLTKSCASYSGGVKIEVHLIGLITKDYLDLLSKVNNKKIKFVRYGKVDFLNCIRIISECDLGIDSLALDRLGFSVSSTLKSKEYVALGMPFIASVPDQDLITYEGALWYRPAIENDIFNLDDVIAWYLSRDSSVTYDLSCITWDAKVEHLLSVIY